MKVCFVTIIGAPNAGKSTLLNQILSYDLSIVTPRSQTTRDQITGVLNEDGYQIVFFDTPGIHVPQNKFGNIMNKNAFESLKGVDVVLFLIPVNKKLSENDLSAINKIESFKNKIAVITKIDLIDGRRHLLQYSIDQLKPYNFKHIVSTTTKNKKSINSLIKLVKKYSYEDQPYYELDAITDKSMRFVAKEVIREAAINNLFEELPYSISVLINRFTERPTENHIESTLFVKRESQRKVVIGHKGEKIKQIRETARLKIMKIFGKKTQLFISVAVAKDWTNDENELKKLEYN